MSKDYITTQGDTWDMISFKSYGVDGYVSYIMDANKTYLETSIFEANVVLTIPDITTAQQIANSAPPWKR